MRSRALGLPIFHRLVMSDHEVPETNCVICSGSAEIREEYFSNQHFSMPLRGVCLACQLTFFAALSPPPSEH